MLNIKMNAMAKKPTDLIFKLEHQFTLYLQRCGITRAEMPPDELRELRRAFYGGCGQMFFVMTQDVMQMKTGLTGVVFDSFVKQLADFWQKEEDEQYEYEQEKAGGKKFEPDQVLSCSICAWEGPIKDLAKPAEGSGICKCPNCGSDKLLLKELP